jgi:glycerate kinase
LGRSAKPLVVAPGAFKHALTAAQAADAIAHGLERAGWPVVRFPVADGGNGTLDCFLAQGGKRRTTSVRDPLGRPITAAFGFLPDRTTAVVEMALASGIELVRRRDALRADSGGTGQLIRAALDRGARRIIVGLGGSATTDGGAGCLRALGVRLMDANGKDIPPGGGGLARLHRIDARKLDPRLRQTELIIAADVQNPVVGENGAAVVFAPQKGASAGDVRVLDANLRRFFGLVRDQIGVDVLTTSGGGAAGGLAAGLMAFTGAQIKPGIGLLLDSCNFDEVAAGAAGVIVGEGHLDAQSLMGKAPIGVAQRASRNGLPVVALCGRVSASPDALAAAGINAAWPIIDSPMPLGEAVRRSGELLERAAFRLGQTLGVITKP